MRHWLLAGTAVTVIAVLWLYPIIAGTGRAGYDGIRNVAANGCPPVPNTPYFTIAYGTVQLDGADAPMGTIVEAVSPRDDVVGCFEVSTAGHYGAMYIYGEDTSVNPPIPGMQDGEEVTFRVDGVVATASPVLVWHDDRESHEVDLTASSPTPTDTPTATPTNTPTPTSTPTDTPTPTPTNTPTSTPTNTPTPTPTSTALPDLIVQDMLVVPESPAPNQSIVIMVTIRNQGDGAANRFFYTDVYADHVPTGCGDVGWDYARTDALGAGEVVSLTFTHTGFADVDTHSFYVQVDSSCQVEETDEENNIYGPLRVEVTDSTPPPEADFTASPTWGFVSLSVQFTDLSTGQVDAWLWAFGDGVTSTLQSSTHPYTLTGIFTVSLTVSGPGGSDVEVKANYITVSNAWRVYLPLVLRSHP